MHQLLKLPVVFQHYAEHKLMNGNISFLQFLDMHYMHGSPMDSDHDRDMQLPFKTIDDCVYFVSNVFIPLLQQPSISAPALVGQKQTYILRNHYIIPAYLANIWQPPKSC